MDEDNLYNDPLMQNKWKPPAMTDADRKLIDGDNCEELGFFLYTDVFTPSEQDEIAQQCRAVLQEIGVKTYDENLRRMLFGDKADHRRIIDSIPVTQRLIERGILESAQNCMYLLQYPADSYIAPHKDSIGQFGPSITGVSLLTETTMELVTYPMILPEKLAAEKMGYENTHDEKRRKISARLPAGSVYIMSGYSRYDMLHEIPKVTAERISITLRNHNN